MTRGRVVALALVCGGALGLVAPAPPRTRRRHVRKNAEDEIWDDRKRRPVLTTRSYVPPGTLELFDGTWGPEDRSSELPIPAELVTFVNPRTVVVGVSFLAYPLLARALRYVPPPNSVEGGYFFSLVSIVFGTLTASTISDATNRLAALRAAAAVAGVGSPSQRPPRMPGAQVEESTLMLPLLRRLRVVLVEDGGGSGHRETYETVARLLWAHAEQGLIRGSRDAELKFIAKGNDALGRATVELQRAQSRYGDRVDLSFALLGIERVTEARGVRLSLENSGIPSAQFRVLRALSTALVIAYSYLTLDRGGPLPHFLGVSEAGVLDSSLGVHVLFSFVCGALLVFNSLAADFDRPFSGVFKLESGTVVATLRQLRVLVAEAHVATDDYWDGRKYVRRQVDY